MSNVGYTIIEPPSLGEWLGTVRNRGMLLALLTWLQHWLAEALKDDFPALRIDVIKVEYSGSYPALGIQCDDGVPSDMHERLDDLTKHILSDSSVTDFLNFALDDGIDWTAQAQTLLAS